ncbi:hypothetical protein F4824DRAFT_470756 [Ustulina deusta]|nr:hypothetical protein F4824DRAFT_470756 [Ustulina deusta]
MACWPLPYRSKGLQCWCYSVRGQLRQGSMAQSGVSLAVLRLPPINPNYIKSGKAVLGLHQVEIGRYHVSLPSDAGTDRRVAESERQRAREIHEVGEDSAATCDLRPATVVSVPSLMLHRPPGLTTTTPPHQQQLLRYLSHFLTFPLIGCLLSALSIGVRADGKPVRVSSSSSQPCKSCRCTTFRPMSGGACSRTVPRASTQRWTDRSMGEPKCYVSGSHLHQLLCLPSRRNHLAFAIYLLSRCAPIQCPCPGSAHFSEVCSEVCSEQAGGLGVEDRLLAVVAKRHDEFVSNRQGQALIIGCFPSAFMASHSTATLDLCSSLPHEAELASAFPDSGMLFSSTSW